MAFHVVEDDHAESGHPLAGGQKDGDRSFEGRHVVLQKFGVTGEIDGDHLVGEDHLGDVEKVSGPDHETGDEADGGGATPLESARVELDFSGGEQEDQTEHQGEQRWTVELCQQQAAEQESQDDGLGARRMEPIARPLDDAGEYEQAADAIDGCHGKMSDQIRRQDGEGEHEVGGCLGKQLASGVPEQKQQRHSEQDVDGTGAVEPDLGRGRDGIDLVVDELIFPIHAQERKGEEQAS